MHITISPEGWRGRPSPLLCATAVALMFAGTALAQRMPNEIPSLYEDVRVAIETEDTESIMSRFTSLLRMDAALGEGWATDLATMFEQRENIAAEVRFDEYEIAGSKAYVLATWALSGATTATGEEWNVTVQRADILLKRDTAWEFLGSDVVDQEAMDAYVRLPAYENTRVGLSLVAPTGWRVIPLAAAKASVVAYSPDLSAMVLWVAVGLPVTMTAEQMAGATADVIDKIGPATGFTSKEAQEGPTELAGRPAYRTTRVLSTDDGLDVHAARTFCVVGSMAYVVAVNAIPPEGYGTHKEAIDRSVASTRIVAAEAVELPPEAGRAEDGTYVNDTHGCRIRAPEGWDVDVQEGDWKIQVTMAPPEGDSTISLGMIDLPAPDITAEQAVVGDDNIVSQAFEKFELIRRGETMVGDLPAYESVTKFDFGGQMRTRYRVYLVDNGRLFFIFADAAPAQLWDRLEPLFKQTVGSFELLEAQTAEGG